MACEQLHSGTVYSKKYAHGFCFAVLCCGYTLTDFPISIRLTSLALWQSNDCPSASKATLMNMDKYFMWIHYEQLRNHNKAKHNKTVCILLGIYCMLKWHANSSIQVSAWTLAKSSDTVKNTCKFRSRILHPTKCVPWFVLVCVAHNQSFVWPHLLIYYTCTGMVVLIGRYISIFLDTSSSWWTMGLGESNLGTLSVSTCIMKSKCYKCLLSEIPVDFWRQHYNNFDSIIPR